MAKAKKSRAKKYEKPLKIEGSLADVLKVSVTNPDKPKTATRPVPKKKK